MPAVFIGGGAVICIIFLLLIFRDVERSALHHDHYFADPVSHVEYDKLQRNESKGSFDGSVAESTYIADEENKEGLNEKSNQSTDTQSARDLMIAGCVLNFATKVRDFYI